MSVTLQDVLLLVEDYISSKTGQTDQDRKIRQVGQAIAYFQRKAGLPSDEKIHRFYFSDDQLFYAAPPDFMEEMQMLYDDPLYNTPDREWNFKAYQELLNRTGEYSFKNEWSVTPINGLMQMVLKGNNIKKGSLIDGLDTVGDWVASGDASGLAQDLLDKKVGDGSLAFDVTYNTGLATLTRAGMSLDVKTLFENHGYFKLWGKFPTALIDSAIIRLYVDNSNYWTITETDFDDGTDFAANLWNKIGWPLDNAVKSGTPEIDETVTKIAITLSMNASFVSGVDFRFDNLFTTIPDYLDFVYRSRYKGTNAAGDTLKETLTDVTDKLAIGEFFPDMADLIARRAAINLWPALRGDKEFMILYQADLREFTRDAYLRFPRRRTNKYPPTKLKR